jgi:hypothetical protein
VCWCPRWNNELYSLYSEPNIVEDIKIRRLELAGHIIGTEEERIPKNVLNGNFHTTRPVGRPRTRWADVVQRDALQLLGTRVLRRRAANRDEWRRLMGEAIDEWMDISSVSLDSSLLCSREPLLRTKLFYSLISRAIVV